MGERVRAGARGVRATAQFFVTRVESRERVGAPRGVPRREKESEREREREWEGEKERRALSRPCTGAV